ncbi:MAG: Abi-alpha family protein [Ginsengibacter sp.]
MKEKVLQILNTNIQNENARVYSAIENALKNFEEGKLTDDLGIVFFETISVLRYLKSTDKMYDYYIKMLALSLNQDKKNNAHPSFIATLKALTIDEMTILKNISLNKYEFISTYDYERSKGFFNYKRIKFDYPKNLLLEPLNFDFYINHLMDDLKLLNWPIYKQDPIIEMGNQTGLTEYSRLVLTVLGERFISCF